MLAIMPRYRFFVEPSNRDDCLKQIARLGLDEKQMADMEGYFKLMLDDLKQKSGILTLTLGDGGIPVLSWETTAERVYGLDN